MKHPSQSEIVLALATLKNERCNRTIIGHTHPNSNTPCDCPAGFVFRPKERSGCPELASAAVLLATLSPYEYAELVRRADGEAPQQTSLGDEGLEDGPSSSSTPSPSTPTAPMNGQANGKRAHRRTKRATS